MKYLKDFLLVILFILGQLLLYSIGFYLTKNVSISYLFSYILIIIYFCFKYKNDLINDLKKIKINKKFLIISFIFTILSIVSHLLLKNYLNIDASNQIAAEKLFMNNKFIMGLNLIVFAPIAEEFIYRYSFNKNNNFISFIIYTLFFSIIHISGAKNMLELLYIIPYLLMSISISLQYYKNKNIFASIIYHMFNNLINIMLIFI